MKPNHKFFLLICCLFQIGISKSHAAIYYITSTDSAGGLQINNAIAQANADSLKDTIYFNIPSAGPFNITLIYPVPVITKPILIDGLSQAGNDTTLWLIRFSCNAGFIVSSSGCTIRGLRMSRTGLYTYGAIRIKFIVGVLDSLKFEQNFIENYEKAIDAEVFASGAGFALDHLTIQDNKFINNVQGLFLYPSQYGRYMKHFKFLRNTFINSPCLIGGSNGNRKLYYTIADNIFQNSELDFHANMRIVNVVRNHFFEQSKLRANISLDSLIISDNYFDSITGPTINISCVQLRIEDTENQKLYFERNNFLQSNCQSLYINLHDTGNDSAAIAGIFIRNNYFQNIPGWGIELGYASSPGSNNIIKDVFIDSNNFSNCLGILLCLPGKDGSLMSNVEITTNHIDLVQLNYGINPLINIWLMSGTMDSIVIRNNILNGSGIECELNGSNNNARRIYISKNLIVNSIYRPAIFLWAFSGSLNIEHFLIDSNDISFSRTGITILNDPQFEYTNTISMHNIKIIQNHIHHNDSCGIIIFNYPFLSSTIIDSVIVEQNIIDSNLYDGIRIYTVMDNSPYLNRTSNILVNQNAITNNSGNGILFRDYGASNPNLSSPDFHHLTYSQNSIYNNGLLGINIENINDPLIPLTPIFPFPVLTNLTIGAGNFTINGYLQADTNQSYTLEFFQNTLPDSSGSGEGETYIGSLNVITNAAGFISYQFPVNGTPGSYYFTSTAINDSTGNTSIFSNDVDITTGINELISGSFKIFPNPAAGKFSIQCSERISQITITNISGEIVFNEKFLVPTLGAWEIDLSNHPKGIYLVHAVKDKKVYNEKIIMK